MNQRHAGLPNDVFPRAVASFRAGDWNAAESLCRQLIAAEPTHADALHLLGLVCGETKRWSEAIASLQQAGALQPSNPVLWTNLGEVYRKAGQFALAIDCQQRAIGLREAFPEAHYHLALAFRALGQDQQAADSARRAIALQPQYAEAHYMIGNIFREEGRLNRAVAAYNEALRLRPNWANAHLNIGAALLELQEPAKAADHYREVLRLEPGRMEAENSLGHAVMALGRVDEAREAYERAALADPESAGHSRAMSGLVRASLAPVVVINREQIEAYKDNVSAAVRTFSAQPDKIDVSNLYTHGAIPSMMLAYFGGNVRSIMEEYARAIAPHISQCQRRRQPGTPRLGVLVTNGHEGVFERCWGGIAQRLSRKLFDVKIVCSRAGANILQTLLPFEPDEYLRVPNSVDEAARLLAEAAFDWLHFWEIGTDPMNYYLPFFRPAAGQSGCWGWPVTSGNPRVDAYLSCEQLEPPDAQAHYTEQLILLKHLPTYYVRPPAPQGPLTKSRFGVDDRRRVYLCTQNVRKYHPDFDALLADLLRTDAEGVLLIIGDSQPAITELLLDRFRRTMPDVMDRVRVMPRLERDEYLALVAVADVMLDTLHYGGGANTVYDAVAVGTPIVTLPGEFQRGRWAMAVNRRLGLPRLIATTHEEYVSTAIEVASNRDWRESLRRQILEAGADLFEDQATVREHEEFFSQAIAACRSGSPA